MGSWNVGLVVFSKYFWAPVKGLRFAQAYVGISSLLPLYDNCISWWINVPYEFDFFLLSFCLQHIESLQGVTILMWTSMPHYHLHLIAFQLPCLSLFDLFDCYVVQLSLLLFLFSCMLWCHWGLSLYLASLKKNRHWIIYFYKLNIWSEYLKRHWNLLT